MDFLFGGRLGRLGYVGGSVVSGLLISVLMMAVGRVFGRGGIAEGNETGAVTAMLVLFAAAILVGLVLTVRRLHDLNMSGWHYAWMVALPALLFGFAFGMHSRDLHAFGVGTELVIWLWVAFWPGTDGMNRYGYRA